MADSDPAAARSASEGTRGRKTEGRVAGVVVRVAVSFGVLAVIFYLLPARELVDVLARISGWVWAGVVIAFLALHALASLKWRLLLVGSGVAATPRQVVRAHASGLFANLCLPSIVGGDVLRAGLVMREHGQAESVALASLADRLGDTVALALIAGTAGLFVVQPADGPAPRIIGFVAVLLALGAVGGLVFLRVLPAERLPEKLARVVGRFRTALGRLLARPGVALRALVLSISIQGSFVGLNIVLAREIGIDLEALVWMLAWPLAKLVALVPISLGGIGVREAAIAGLLAPFGVATSTAVGQSLAWEAVLVGSGLLAGAFALASGVKPTALGGDTAERGAEA